MSTEGQSTGEEITKKAFDAFVEWCKNHDPQGEWSVIESIGRYRKWCETADRIVKWTEEEFDDHDPQ